MDFLGSLAGRMPGLMAGALAGRNAAEAERYKRAQAAAEAARRERELEAQMRTRALQDSLLQFQVDRMPLQAQRDDQRWGWEQGNQAFQEELRPRTLRSTDLALEGTELDLENKRQDNTLGQYQLRDYESPQEKRARDNAAAMNLMRERGGSATQPFAVRERVNKLQGAVDNIDLAIGAMVDPETMQFTADAQQAFGSSQTWRNAMPGLPVIGEAATPFVNRFMDRNLSPEAIAIRAQIASAGSMLLNLLSGAAISPAEYVRLKGFVPDVNESDPATTLTKLRNLRRELDASRERYLQGGTSGGALTPEDFAAQLEAQGASPADIQAAMGAAYGASAAEREGTRAPWEY